MDDYRISWDAVGERYYETGVNKGVLYPYNNGSYSPGVAWNGLTSVSESPSGAEPTPLYADNIKYLNLMSTEEFGATIEAYTYPDEFMVCDGSAEIASGIFIGQQKRELFGLSYVTQLGNDVSGTDYGYKVHLIYGALASPSEKAYSTINDSPEAITLSWELSTTPVEVGAGFKPTASVTIDSTKFSEENMAALATILYGEAVAAFDATKTYEVGDFCEYEGKIYKCKTAISDPAAWSAEKWDVSTEKDARLPLPSELIELFGEETVNG